MKLSNRGVYMGNYMLASTLCFLLAASEAQTNASRVTAGEPAGQVTAPLVIASELELRGTVPAMFASLVKEVGLAGGVAIPNQDCSHGQEGSLSVPAGTSFDKALGQVVKNKAMSKEHPRVGVANLLPAGGPPPLLLVRIRRFEWDRTAPVIEVINRLRQLPEVSEEIMRLGLREAPIEGGMSAICIQGDCSPKPKPLPVLEAEEGETLLTMLNRIVQAHKGSVWSYSEYRCGKDTLFSLDVMTD
jgi:hypothetical protein